MCFLSNIQVIHRRNVHTFISSNANITSQPSQLLCISRFNMVMETSFKCKATQSNHYSLYSNKQHKVIQGQHFGLLMKLFDHIGDHGHCFLFQNEI